MSDRVVTAITRDGRFRLRVAKTDALVTEALIRHLPGDLASMALGRALTSTAIFPVSWKDCERISLQWSGRGPLGTLLTEIRRPGNLRGLISCPRAESRPGYPGWRGVGYGLLPGGFLGVIRQAEGGSFNRGQVELTNGEIDEDLEGYFSRSEQVPTRLRSLVRIGDHGLTAKALGVLVQCLPGHEDADAHLPDRLLHERLQPDDDLEKALEIAAEGAAFEVLDEVPLQWACTCSRDRILDGVSLLEVEEINTMIREDAGAQITCDFCSTIYNLNGDDLEEVLRLKEGRGGP